MKILYYVRYLYLVILDTILNKICLVQNGELILIYFIFLYLIIFSTTKSVSYTEHDDDDDGKFLKHFSLSINFVYLDFISKVDNAKKNRNTKSNDQQIESKSSTRQPPRKRNEKFVLFISVNQSIKILYFIRISKTEQEELDLALQISKETVQTSETSVEISIISDEKESSTSQSTVSSNGRNKLFEQKK
jgi:hypothetical protein